MSLLVWRAAPKRILTPLAEGKLELGLSIYLYISNDGTGITGYL